MMEKAKKLTQKRLKELLIYDSETGIFIRIKTPGKRTDLLGKRTGNPGVNGHCYIQLDGKQYLASRLAWFYTIGKWPEDEIDHIDLNSSNNKWDNLREATRKQNSYNRPKHKNNTSGYKGVTRQPNCNKWKAQIMINRKMIYLGLFQNIEDAAKAYKEAAIKYFGEYHKI